MILEAAILDVISGRKESSKRCLQKPHPSSRAWMDIFLINSSIVSKHPIVFFYWCNGKRWKRIQLAFAARPNIRSGRNYSTIFMIHSLLCSITNWHFKTRNKKAVLLMKRVIPLFSITNLTHRVHQLKIVSIGVGQGGDESAAHIVRLFDNCAAKGLDALELLFDLRGFKIEHHTPRVFGVAAHF